MLIEPLFQPVNSTLIIGENSTLIGGHAALEGITYEYEFLKNENNEFFVLKYEENNLSRTSMNWFWKIDENIKKAEAFLEAGKLDSAEIAYTTAIQTNPKHYYLKDALAHINYVKSIDSVALINQYKEVEGTYGPRVIWIENGMLFYKRTAILSIGQFQLLPISKTRYINLTRLRDNFGFEYKDGKAIASFAWQFNCEKMEWEKSDSEVNYFRKDGNELTAITMQ